MLPMKSTLAILLSFLLAESPAFALHGGYTLGGSGTLAGSYAGVLIPTSETAVNGATNTFGNNDLGLFLMNVPNQGLATGTVAIFASGSTFRGTLQALPDPSNGAAIRGVINASFTNNGFTYTTAAGVQVTESIVEATAGGAFSASVSNSGGGGNSVSTGTQLTGTAHVEVESNPNGFFFFGNGQTVVTEVADFALDGIQQSTSFTSSTASLNNASTLTQ